MAAWGVKLCFNLCRRDSASPVQRLEGKTDVVEITFDAVIDHLKIPRIEYDPRRIAVFEQDFLRHMKGHQTAA